MARCFCGCGRRVKLGRGGVNRQGKRTTKLIRQLREAQANVPPNAPPALDPEFTLAEEIDGTANAGEHFEEFWADQVHGDDSRSAHEINQTRMHVSGGATLGGGDMWGEPEPEDQVRPVHRSEAMAIRQEFTEWRAEAKALLDAASRVT